MSVHCVHALDEIQHWMSKSYGKWEGDLQPLSSAFLLWLVRSQWNTTKCIFAIFNNCSEVSLVKIDYCFEFFPWICWVMKLREITNRDDWTQAQRRSQSESLLNLCVSWALWTTVHNCVFGFVCAFRTIELLAELQCRMYEYDNLYGRLKCDLQPHFLCLSFYWPGHGAMVRRMIDWSHDYGPLASQSAWRLALAQCRGLWLRFALFRVTLFVWNFGTLRVIT